MALFVWTTKSDCRESCNRRRFWMIVGAPIRKVMFVIAALGVSPVTWALESAQARVTFVEATYMPTQVLLQVDTGTASCPAGKWLTWVNGNADNVKAVFGLLIAAVNSGNRVQYFINNGDTNCQVQFLYAVAS